MRVLPQLFSFNNLKDTYKTASNFSVFVYRAIKRGEIKQIKRGLYALVNPLTGEVFANRFQVASHLFDDSYVSYHEALEYYGLANQSFVSVFNYVTSSHGRDFEFNNVIYKAKKPSSNLFIKENLDESIRIVSLERAIVDSIDEYSLAGGLEEVESALDICPDLNLEDIKTLLLDYDKKLLYQKVGYLFEKHFGEELPKEFYDFCLKRSGNTIVYLDCHVGEAKHIAKWKLMVKKEKKFPNKLI